MEFENLERELSEDSKLYIVPAKEREREGERLYSRGEDLLTRPLEGELQRDTQRPKPEQLLENLQLNQPEAAGEQREGSMSQPPFLQCQGKETNVAAPDVTQRTAWRGWESLMPRAQKGLR